MTHVIPSLCLRDTGCADDCPAECIQTSDQANHGRPTILIPALALSAALESPNARIMPFSRWTKSLPLFMSSAEKSLTNPA